VKSLSNFAYCTVDKIAEKAVCTLGCQISGFLGTKDYNAISFFFLILIGSGSRHTNKISFQSEVVAIAVRNTWTESVVKTGIITN